MHNADQALRINLSYSTQPLFPNTHSSLPNPQLTIKCQPTAQAIAYRYFGENTVQINKCVRNKVQAAITATKLAAVKAVVAVLYMVQLSMTVADLASDVEDASTVTADIASVCSLALSCSIHALLLDVALFA